MTETQPTRQPSAIDTIAEDHAREFLALSPSARVALGTDGDLHALDDYSPEGRAAFDDLNARTLQALRKAADAGVELDSVDQVTIDAMSERLGLERELYAAGLSVGELNNIASPLQDVRDLFDLVPTDTDEDWANNAGKLRCVPQALAGYQRSLAQAVQTGHAPAMRQVKAAIEQAQEVAAQGGHFDKFVAKAQAIAGPRTIAELQASASSARAAYMELAAFLQNSVAPHAREHDATGRDNYVLRSRQFLGSSVDLDETYEWGLEQLASIDKEQQEIVAKLYPGLSVHQAIEKLNNDPARQLHGIDALRAWMQDKADEAITGLAGTHFDIAEPLRTIECMVLADGTGGIYYTGPTDDFSRPGRMWWSVPAGVEVFNTWQELTTVYHEGVPGHHLQVAQATYLRDTLNTWRRNLCWVSGHGEGWALYAERLMADLGYLDDPGDYLGMLDSQRLRAARVCLDLGVHLEKKVPASLGDGTWDANKAWQFLTDNVAMDRSFLAFELTRYLGWPGQAPSYKIGQRLWEEARDEAKAAATARGEEFSLKDFHTRALNLGSVGLDTLNRALSKV